MIARLMLTACFLLPVIATPATAEELCADYSSTLPPHMQWKESDFNQAAADQAVALLKGAVSGSESVAPFRRQNAYTQIEGFLLKQKAAASKADPEKLPELTEFDVQAFCNFVVRTEVAN